MRVIGIDPWTTTVGYAIIEVQGRSKTILDYWVIHTTPKIPFEEKIMEIAHDLDELIRTYQPERAVVEKLYFSTNTKTAIDVAGARGVIIYCLKSAHLPIFHFTPLELKKAICWNGTANKLQLQRALTILFHLDEIPKPDDAADAIGLALMGALQKK